MKKLLILALFALSTAAFAEPVNLPNLGKNATGTSLGGGHYGLDISGSITASSTSNGNTGSAVPAQATLVGGTDSGTLRAVSVDSSGKVNVNATVSTGGLTVLHSVRNAYASTAVTTGAWVELISSTSGVVNGVFIFDSSGQTLELGTGAAASEAHLIYVVPGGPGYIPLKIATSTRVSIRAVTATASVGEFDGEFMQ